MHDLFTPSPDTPEDAALASALDAEGHALLPRLLTPDQCRQLAGRYMDESLYRSTVVMARHGFGRGEYRYFAYPLPPLLKRLRHALYPRLVPIANCWNAQLGLDVRYPATLAEFLDRCHRAGQRRPTPLILSYREGDHNCLHQDLYGEHVFPLQAAFLLDEPGRDFEGGEFVLVEQRPRQQSRPQVVPLKQGEGVIFAVRERPATGTRGVHRRVLRHGVSTVRSGRRRVLGVIFHDAT
jgi:hypothetical protein